MEDGGHNAHAGAAGAAAAAGKKKEDGKTLLLQPRHPVPFAQTIPGITDALRERLEALGATEPLFMIGKSLVPSDVNPEEARLLLSCRRELLLQLTSVFTETETRFVEDKATGLLVTAFDRNGRSYKGYRFITRWKAYFIDNSLGVGMRVDRWWFRSPKLPNRYEQRQGKKGKRQNVPITVESGNADGSLGLVLLQYEKPR